MTKTGGKGYLSYLPVPYAPQTIKLPGTGWLETEPDADGVRVPAGRGPARTR